MIDRLLLKNALSFKEIELDLHKNLIVITGPSGAGKSILIDSILSIFGIKEFIAEMGEISSDAVFKLEEYGIESDELTIFKALRNEKTRYFVNNQQISKKNLKELASSKIKYISHKDFSDFNNETLIDLLDSFISANDPAHTSALKTYKGLFTSYVQTQDKLTALEEEELKVEELKEFCKIQIEKIDSIDPKEGELEELLDFKKKLSKIEKLKESLESIGNIFELEEEVYKFYTLLEADEKQFGEAMNELRDRIESANDFLLDSDEQNIDAMLDRIEKLSALNKRFGSTAEALAFRDEKKKELEHYENLSFEKKHLQKAFETLQKECSDAADNINQQRNAALESLEGELNGNLSKLKLQNAKLALQIGELDPHCGANVTFDIKGASLEKVSSGEFNRIRLAILALRAKYTGDSGVLILDEIDSNLSGEESKAAANLLKELSGKYQIIVISHQPHLPALASQHILVEKSESESRVKELSNPQRVDEIARMISGKERTTEAILFAKDLLRKAGFDV